MNYTLDSWIHSWAPEIRGSVEGRGSQRMERWGGTRRLWTRPWKRSQPIKAVISLTDLPNSDAFTFMLCDPAKSHFTVLIFLLPRNKDTKTNKGNFFRGQWKHMDIETKCLAFEYIHLESFTHSPVYSLRKHYCRSRSGHCTRHWKQTMNKADIVPPPQNSGDFPQGFLEQKDLCSFGSARTPMAYNCLEVLGHGDLGKVGEYIAFLGGPGALKGKGHNLLLSHLSPFWWQDRGRWGARETRVGCWTPGNVIIAVWVTLMAQCQPAALKPAANREKMRDLQKEV